MIATECPSQETLKQWLASLPGEGTCRVSAHIRTCQQCQALLDRLSDDSGLRQWLPEDAVKSAEEDAGLLRLRRGLLVSSTSLGSSLPGKGIGAGGLSFLGPPSRSGDLGVLGSYLIEEELGRGGMGIVLRGLDPSLGRPVAVKVLRPDRNGPGTRARFVREAQAAAQLRHDHVVAVYAVAETPEGLPYFTMEYIPGPTLAERIQSIQRLEPRQAATIAAEVAAGLAAAHGAGLVHRDLKPSNILLDPVTGHAKIADFGLVQLEASTSGLTEVGVLIGTPAYMSPEQVRGDDTIDARSDVYNLGVTLYETLTGEVPFRGTAHAILQQVLHDEPRPPRQLNEAVSRDLETVCLKAMAKEPSQRYATAAELRTDLDRFLQGVPVRARPLGALGRWLRWCRRQPGMAALSGALILVAVLGFAAVSWQWWRAETKAQEALDNAKEATDNATKAETQHQAALTHLQESRKNFQDARRAVDTFFTLAEKHNLFQQPGGSPLRKQLLAEALRYYQGFVLRQGDDPTVRLELADAYFRLGFLLLYSGDRAQSLAAIQQALAGYGNLLKEKPSDTALRRSRAFCYFQIGDAHWKLGRLPEAIQGFEGARDDYAYLSQAEPGAVWLRSNYTAALGNVANLHYQLGHRAEALHHYLKIKTMQEQLVRAYPKDLDYRLQLARTLSNLGYTGLGTDKDPDASLKFHEQARAVREELHRTVPASTLYRFELAACRHLGGLFEARKQWADALTQLDRASALLRPAIQAEPHMLQYQQQLAEVLSVRGRVLSATGKLAEALSTFEEERRLLESLLTRSPHERDLRNNLAVSLERIAGNLLHQQKHTAALAAFESLRKILEGLRRDFPKEIIYQKSDAEARKWIEHLRNAPK